MLTISCPGCKRPISSTADLRFPPWCPKCGADIRVQPGQASVPSEPSPPTSRAVAPIPRPTSAPLPLPVTGPLLPAFNLCVPSLWSESSRENFRAYVTARSVLVFHLDPKGNGRAVVIAGATMLGGVVGGLIASSLTEPAKHAARNRSEMLDVADEETLRRYLEEDSRHFVMKRSTAWEFRIESPSAYYRYACATPHEAVLRFTHKRLGDMTMVLPTVTDVRRAVEHLPGLFGDDEVTVDLDWVAG